jgi:hypothetical protein
MLKADFMNENNNEGGHTSTNNKQILIKDGGVTGWGNTYTLLCEGLNPTQISKKQELSRKTIHKRVNFYLDTGKIEKITWGTYRKATKKSNPPPISHPALLPPLPIMLPHKFGAIFAQTGKPNLEYDKYGKAQEKTELYCAQFGKWKTQIWLYSGFIGTRPDELIQSGRQLIEAIAQTLSLKYNISLTLIRFYSDIEWVDISKERSAATAKGADIKKGREVLCAGAIHKFSDETHEGQIEFNKYKDSKIPTDHAKVREYIYSGRLADDLYALMEGMKQIKMRMDMEAKP